MPALGHAGDSRILLTLLSQSSIPDKITQHMKKHIHYILSASALLLLFHDHASATTYRITELGDLSGGASYSVATSINNAGQVVGYSESASGLQSFLWQSGNIQGLGYLPGGSWFSVANSINELGHVAGTSQASTGARAFIWSSSEGVRDLGDLPGGADISSGNALNDAGQVVGSSRTANGDRAFLWDNNSGLQNLGSLPSWAFNSSFATGVNNAGLVVGYGESQYLSTQTKRAFLWSSGGAMEDLGDLSPNTFSYTVGRAINDQGQVVGSSALDPIGSLSHERAFLWSASTGMQDLGALAGDSDSWAYSINDRGQVVGMSASSESGFMAGHEAFIWESGQMHNLNSLIDSSDPLFGLFTLTAALDINDLGQIVGYGTLSGELRAFLITPEAATNSVPEPPPLGLMVSAGIGALIVSRKKKTHHCTARRNTKETQPPSLRGRS